MNSWIPRVTLAVFATALTGCTTLKQTAVDTLGDALAAVAEVARATLPLLAVMFLGVLLITYFPPLTTWLPQLLSRSSP